jgi:polyphosphate kinase
MAQSGSRAKRTKKAKPAADGVAVEKVDVGEAETDRQAVGAEGERAVEASRDGAATKKRGRTPKGAGAVPSKARRATVASEARAVGSEPGSARPARSKRARTAKAAEAAVASPTRWKSDWLDKKTYEKELAKLQVELVKLQAWVQQEGLRVVVLFEGRDAAGKGGTIKRVTESLNPRYCRVVALPKPTERERTQWYFQRYVEQLPAAGEIVLFDRSWYNRAGVERVMGFCTEEEYQEFFRTCPEFERMLVRSGTILIKYWFSVSPEEQERRFQSRLERVTKHWKLSPMDLEARQHWVEYSRAKDTMFAYTDIKQAPWYVVGADDKRRARLNCISHLLSMIPYQDVIPRVEALPPRDDVGTYVRPPMAEQTFVPERY